MSYRLGLKRVVPLGRLQWEKMGVKYSTSAPQPVTSVDYLSKLPANLGMMLNDTLGDCFEAAIYHGDQVRTLFTNGTMRTQPDADVQKLYELATGYNPADPNSDQGSDPREVFSWIEKNGLPMGADGTPARELIAAFEINPHNMQDVIDAMDACGGLMVGFNVPDNIMTNPPQMIWHYDPNAQIVGGHEVLCGKMLSPTSNIGLISWGSPHYQMGPVFWKHYVTQVTACVWSDWFEATGKSPFGMTRMQMEAEFQAMSDGPIP